MLDKAIKHFVLITKHRFIVFKLCCRAGIPWRGFVHDLSKYSPTEFFESVKYFNGKHSPIAECKKEKSYSEAWLHHKGRNKHHYEYWYDDRTKEKTLVIPYKYSVEMLCDTLAASMVYVGKGWTIKNQIDYWDKEKLIALINKKNAEFLTNAYRAILEDGMKAVLNKRRLTELYNKSCN